MAMKPDFSGWATKANLRCSDGVVIAPHAFKDCMGTEVPLVWMHQHNDPFNVLGHAMLEDRNGDVFANCYFNDSESGQQAKKLVEHGDVKSLSIFANQLTKDGTTVKHGKIIEVSLVLAGANPGARIVSQIMHGDETIDLPETEGVLYSGEGIEIQHAEKEDDKKKSREGKTVEDVFNAMTDEQKNVVYAIVEAALGGKGEDADDKKGEDADDKKDLEEQNMKHNVFDQDNEQKENTLSHSEMSTIISDAKRYGSMKDSFLAHAEEYGIDNIEYLFPDAKTQTDTPAFISRDMGWVNKVLGGVHHTPFSRVKTVFANITEDDARAKGYLKGNLKKEEVFSLLKRTTEPTTIYKKQKMDRDDVIDITDFNVVAWLKTEMRMMLNEELARAILIGDGRMTSSDEKIDEMKIRPIYNDAELFTIQAKVSVSASATDDDKARAFIRAAIKERKNYKGSGMPTLYTTEDWLNTMLLLTDTTGRDIYTDVAQLAKKLRVKEIVTVPVMEGKKAVGGGDLIGVLVNMDDYGLGADKGGAINMFEDFDINYNQQLYLIETRCSGALRLPYSAIAFELTNS